MPPRTFLSVTLIAEGIFLIGGLKWAEAAKETITLILKEKVVLLSKQQGGSRLNLMCRIFFLQRASQLIFSCRSA